jgi:hypothetical protein
LVGNWAATPRLTHVVVVIIAQDGSGDEGDDAMEEDTEGKTSATNGTDSKE